MKIEWRTIEDYQESTRLLQHDKIDYFICSGCNRRISSSFLIVLNETPKVKHLLCELCPGCFEELQVAISPLSVLVQTGKDTK